MDESNITRISLDFTDDDIEVLEAVKTRLEREMGKVPNVTVFRTVLRRELGRMRDEYERKKKSQQA